MKLYEYETKEILKEYNIPTPKGEVVTPVSVLVATSSLKPPFAIKAQVLVAGRGKAGGILFASSIDEAKKAAEKLFKTQIKSISVKKVLIEEKVSVRKELYVGLTIDRTERKYAFITSEAGGVDIEEIAEKTPQRIIKTMFIPRDSYEFSDAREIACRLGYEGNQQAILAEILFALTRAGIDYDAELIEINPLVETENGDFVAVDCRLIIDDNALFRHKEWQELLFSTEREGLPQEIEALKDGLVYVKLEGNIGILGNGAGLVMATLDMIQHYGGKPANFLDLGGGASMERIMAALKIVLSDTDVKVLFINILGGITRCDDVARGIVDAKSEINSQLPVVVRLVGTNEGEGKRILTVAGLQVLDSMEEAAMLAVRTANA